LERCTSKEQMAVAIFPQKKKAVRGRLRHQKEIREGRKGKRTGTPQLGEKKKKSKKKVKADEIKPAFESYSHQEKKQTRRKKYPSAWFAVETDRSKQGGKENWGPQMGNFDRRDA